jgi:hypothetical protein
MCKIKIWYHTILPTSVSFQTILIILTLILGGVFEILVRHFLDLVNHSFLPRQQFNLVNGLCYLHQEGVQYWTLPLEIIVIGGITAAIITFINRANRNQHSVDIERENTLIEGQQTRDSALIASIDSISENIEKLITQKENQNSNKGIRNGNKDIEV